MPNDMDEQRQYSGNVGEKLKQQILLPLTVMFCLSIAAFSAFIYHNERVHLDESFERELGSMQASYREMLTLHGNNLRMALAFLENNQALHATLAAGDRAQLQTRFAPLFEKLKIEFNITHFYLLDANRVTLLRLHQPERFGDRIERVTAREAERTGRLAIGMELGPLGTLTLRAVMPLREGGRIIGYVELGEEALDIVENISREFSDDVYVLLHKKYLSRLEWEQGMRMLKRKPEWDHYPDFIVTSQTRSDIPPELDRIFAQGERAHKLSEITLQQSGQTYRLGFIPLLDISMRDVGDFAVLRNITATTTQTRQLLLMFIGAAIGCSALLFTMIYLILGRIQRALATQLAERKQAGEEIENLAFYDPLTQLPNRRLLMDRLKQALAYSARSGREGALLFLDLDNFKSLNDTLGHDIGDQLLKQVAERLESCTREGDTVSRLGGDEFVVMLEDLSEQDLESAAQVEAVGEKILATLNQPYQLGKHQHHSTPSIGVTLFNDHEYGVEGLLKQADIAMYQAKKAGRNTLRFFDPQMQDAITTRVALESDLRRAVVEQEQFQLHYQVQIDSSGGVTGAEALLRWQHPERGMVFPADFIQLAEETGLIQPLGRWVMTTACQQLATWAVRPETAHLSLAVNVSSKQFHLPTFVEEVLTLVDHFKIDSTKLKLEITESMLLGNVDDTIIKMTALKVRGVNFSMDDFGTGYSSLQYLKLLPLDQIKIDQSFVRDIATDDSDKAIVRTIIAMAQSMKLSVIAEGVETEEQRQLLLDKGCTNYQGYLFGRPVPIAQFDALLKQG